MTEKNVIMFLIFKKQFEIGEDNEFNRKTEKE